MVGYLHSTEHPPVFHSVHCHMLLGFPRWRFPSSVCLCHCKCFPFLKQQGSFWWLLKRKVRKKTETIFCTWTWMGNRYPSSMLGYSHFKSQDSNHLLSSLAACGPAQTVLVKWHSASNIFSLACTPGIMKYLSWGIQGTWKSLQATGNWGRHQLIFCIQSQKKSFANLPFSSCLLKIGKDQPDKVFQRFSLKPRK